MTVWVVWEAGGGWESSDRMIGIFSTEEKADAFIAQQRKQRFTATMWTQEEEVQ